MRKGYVLLSFICMMMWSALAMQADPATVAAAGGVVMGKVTEENSGTAIEYANIALYSTQDSSLVTGGITDADGKFKISALKPGNYYATVKFIGYEMQLLENISISKKENFAKLGTITLTMDAHNLNALDVVADKQQVLFKIDKKIVNPSQFLAAQGGTAVDILANTPSVTVDIEGNVSMRGSSNFMVLINGKPTPFEASDALAQVPASSIENIEIITNPSAKHDPDGAAGIINIITKKEAQMGWNGIANVSMSTLGSYSGNFLFNFTDQKARWYMGASRSDRLRSADYYNGSGTIDIDPLSPAFGDTIHIKQDGTRTMSFYSNSVKGGVDYDLNASNTVGVELQAGWSGRNFDSELDNREWSTGEPEVLTYALAETRAHGTFGAITLSQSSQFGDDKLHKLESSIFYQKYKGEDDTYSDKEDDSRETLITQQTWEDGNSSELRVKSDYTRPWEKGKIEGGYQLRVDDSWSNYDAKFNPEGANTDFYNESTFFRMINSAYATFSGESGQFGYQLGLRGEHTLRQIEDYSSDISEINRLDWYPTVHLSYNLSESQSFMTSYTRRIDRPRGHWLDPYIMWRDPNNVRQGNPDLNPQYVDSYEMSYQLRFDDNFLSAEVFHRHVGDKMERIRSKYQDGVIMTAYENVGDDFSTGLELMLNYNIAKWWNASVSGTLYDYRINVYDAYSNNVSETQSNNWRVRWSNTFKPSQTLRFQFDAMYKSASVNATGTTSDMIYTSLAVKKSFFKRKLDVGVSLLDVFNTANMEMSGSGDTYYSNYSFDMKSPYLQFTLTYVFNNYKADRRKGSEGGSSMEMDF